MAVDRGIEGLERLHLNMGLQCNVRCTMCYQTDFSSRQDMPESLWRDKLLPAYEHVRVVKLQGGETTIMKNCRSAAKLLRGYPNARLEILTNGVLIDDFWHETFVEQCGYVSFSINAATKASYEKIVLHGEWARVIKNIERLLSSRRGSLPRVAMSMVLLKENVHEIAALIDLAGSMGADAVPLLVDPLLTTRGLPKGDELLRELARAREAAERWPKLEILGLDELCDRLLLPVSRGAAPAKKKPMCVTPFRNLVVDWNGDVRVCCNTWVTIGNLHEKSVVEIFQGHLARRFRDKMKRDDYTWCSAQCEDNANPTKLALFYKYAYETRRDPRMVWSKVEQKASQLRGKLRAAYKRSRPLGDPVGAARSRGENGEANRKVRLPVVG
jgi:MoaA/NifB/PqqE/SkfB family radical SAM enzyme